MTARLTLAALLAGAALPAPPALAQTPPAPPVAAVAVKPLAFTARTLANGLRVYAMRDATTPNVAVQVWYDVGARDDPAGRSGFAHLFEHLMFKGTRNLAPEQFDRLTEDVGGYNNASTDDDYTNYFEVVPANHLERLLFAEGDRMASLAIEPGTFKSERAVVEEEYRQRVLAQPYGKLFGQYLPNLAYQVSPYARPPIGSIADLEAASIDDVRAFHATYYRPDNAVVVVAGNFDPAQLDRWVDRYLGSVARPAYPIPRVTVTEPARTAPVTRTVYETNTPLPAVLLNWHVPADRGPDTAALTVLDAVLGTGESSRLYQALVYRDGLANSADAQLDTRKDVGNLNVYAIMAGGKPVAAGEAALRAEVARLRDAPVTAAELARAKAQLVTGQLRRRQTAEGRAFILASSVIVDGDPHAADQRLAAIQRVTAADVQAAARRYLGDDQVAVLRYLPAEGRPAGAAGDAVALASTVVTRPLAAPAGVAVVTPADAAHRLAPPAPGPAARAALPTPSEQRLTNGVRVVVVERHDLPLVTAQLVALGGSGVDPAGEPGVAALAATVMGKGTDARTAPELAAAMETLGAGLNTDAGRDSAAVSATVAAPALPAAAAILAEVVRRPAFAPAELDRARAQAVDAVAVAMTNPPQLAAMAADRRVFGARPYGAPADGTPASLAAVTRADLLAAYGATWRPDRTALVLVGDVTPAAARALAERLLGDWRAPAAAPAARAEPPLPGPSVTVIDLPGAGQAGVVVARPGIARADPRYAAAQVANAVLGGGFSSRLNQEIRVKRGLAYGAGSNLSARRDGGEVAARTQTKNVSAPDAVALILAELARLGAEPVAPAELETRRAALVGEIGRAVETDEGLAGTLGNYIATGVPVAELPRAIDRIVAVDAAAVARAGRLFDPAAASVVVVGDAAQFLPALRARYPNVAVIPAKAVKLDSPTLR